MFIRTPFCVVLMLTCHYSFAQKITYDYDSKADFKKYKTYAWLAPGDSVLNRYRADKTYGGFITYAANQELKDRGLKIDTVGPEAIFVFQTQYNDYTKYTQSPTLSVGLAVAGPGYYMAGSAPVAGGKITESTEAAGAFVVSMYDVQTRRMIWTGRAEKTFKYTEDVQKIVGDAIKKVFKKLPIKKK
jgi:Domain of unknown function (DUF4136)